MKKAQEQNVKNQTTVPSSCSVVQVDSFELLIKTTRRQLEAFLLRLSDKDAETILEDLTHVSSQLEQLESFVEDQIEMSSQKILVECLLKHSGTSPVVPVGNLVNLYLDHTLNTDERISTTLGKIINLLIPLEFSKQSIHKISECLRGRNSVVVEGAVGSRTGAEVIMAAGDSQPTYFPFQFPHSTSGQISPDLELETPPLSEASESKAVLLMLKDLASSFLDTNSFEMNQLNPQKQRDHYVKIVRGRVEACYESRRTPYCVHKLPTKGDSEGESNSEREEVLKTINEVSNLVKTDLGTIVFVELCNDGRAFDISAETKLLTFLNRINSKQKKTE